MEFRLGTSFETEVELASVRDNLVDDRLHLVDLDRIDDKALSFEVVLFLCLLIALSHLLNAVVENIGEAEQHRRGDIAQGELVHDIAQIDLRVVLARRDIDITLIVYSEIRSTPTINIVQLLGVVDGPFFHLISVVNLLPAHGKPSCCFSCSTVICILSKLSIRLTSSVCLALA